MSKNEKFTMGIATLALVVAIGVAMFGGGTTTIDRTITNVIEKALGGVTNFDSLTLGEDLVVSGTSDVSTFTQGGGIRSTSTNDTTALLLASDFDTESIIDFTPNITGITLSLPASSTMTSFAPTAGDIRTVYIRNATTTVDIGVIIAGGTGTLLRTASTTSTIMGDVGGNTYGQLIFIRKADTDFDVLFQTYLD